MSAGLVEGGGRAPARGKGRAAKRLPRGLLVRVVLRGLFLQASWNFERMQHLGFCFALLPVLRRVHPPGSPGRAEALRRHLEFFNTHPAMASVILGAVARLEADGQGAAAQTCKLGLMGSYGAIGDSFFWGALRPAAGVAGLTAGLLWALGGLPGGLAGAAALAPAVMLALFNAPQLWLRAFGVFVGAAHGIAVVEAVRRFAFPELTARIRRFGAAALGLAAATLAGVPAAAPGIEAWPGPGPSGLPPPADGWAAAVAVLAAGALILAAVLGAFALAARGVVPTRLAWVLAAVALAGAVWL